MEFKYEEFMQINNEEFLQNRYGKEQWIQVAGHSSLNGADAGFYCGLIDIKKIETVFKDHCWDIHYGDGCPGFLYYDSDATYYKNVLEEEGKEVLVFKRDFYGIKPSTIEIAEEFRLLNNLYFDINNNAYYSIKEDGQVDEAIRICGEAVYIKLSYLIRYISAKQMALLLFFDIRFEYSGTLKDINISECSRDYRTDDLYYSIWVGENSFPIKSYSIIMGKKIIFPRPKQTCGFWPYEKPRNYIDYIIGVDENGEEKSFTSDPEKLGNYFGANPKAPHYLTPVFFKKEVLHKYYSDPSRYRIENSRLECGYLWGLSLDLDHKDYVMVYLGDLGRDLPESEQIYWRSYNVATDEKISRSSFLRDFLNCSESPEIADIRFKNLYKSFNKSWENKFGWCFYLPLESGDEYNLDNLRIPLNENQEEFDHQVLSLNKLLVDSINEKQLSKSFSKTEDMKGIKKLEEWCKVKGIVGYEPKISFLRNLQELRSAGTGHRKGKSYKKIEKVFGLDRYSLKDVFDDILKAGIEYLLFMQDQIPLIE